MQAFETVKLNKLLNPSILLWIVISFEQPEIHQWFVRFNFLPL